MGGEVRRQLRRDRFARAGLIVFGLVVLISFAGAPVAAHLLGHGPNQLNPSAVNVDDRAARRALDVGPGQPDLHAAPLALHPGRGLDARPRPVPAAAVRRPDHARDRLPGHAHGRGHRGHPRRRGRLLRRAHRGRGGLAHGPGHGLPVPRPGRGPVVDHRPEHGPVDGGRAVPAGRAPDRRDHRPVLVVLPAPRGAGVHALAARAGVRGRGAHDGGERAAHPAHAPPAPPGRPGDRLRHGDHGQPR